MACVNVSPIRALLPFSVLFIVLPCVFREELLNVIAIPVFFFLGSYFFLLNFPQIGNTLHAKPLYVEDLIVEYNDIQDKTFHKIYTVTMNFLLAVIFASISEYIILQDLVNKPLVEIFAIIGGNVSLYMKVQNITGKLLLKIFYTLKQTEVRKRKMSEENHSRTIELTEQKLDEKETKK